MMERFALKRLATRLGHPLFCLAALACSEPADPGATGGAGPAVGGKPGSGGSPWASGGATAGAESGGSSAGGQPAGGTSAGGASATGGTPEAGGSAATGGNFMDNYPQGPNWEATSYRIGALCGNSICHNGLELFSLMEDNHLYETLLGRAVKQCGGVPLVDPGNPEGSALLMLTTRKCGDFVMPDGCGTPVCMPEYWIPELTEWIQNGASDAIDE